MPRDKWDVNCFDRRWVHGNFVKRMRAAGAGLRSPEPEAEWIRIYWIDPIVGDVRSWSHATVFALNVRIVGVAPKIAIQGFRLTSPGSVFDAYILEDPLEGALPATFIACSIAHTILDWKPSIIISERRGSSAAATPSKDSCSPSVRRPSLLVANDSMPLSLSILNQLKTCRPSSFGSPGRRIRNPRPRSASREPLLALKSAAPRCGQGPAYEVNFRASTKKPSHECEAGRAE